MRFTQLPIAILLIFSLSGCGLIRLIFGGGDDEGPVSPQGIESLPAPQGDGYTGLRVHSYFLIQPSYKCTDANGSKIESYRDRIDTYDNGTFVQTGDLCSESEKAKGNSGDLEISGDLLGYGNGIYQKEK